MNHYTKYLAILISAALLAGCTTDEELQAGFHKRCVRLGFKPGTDGFANCLMTTENNYYSAVAGIVNSNNQALQANKPVQTRCSTYSGMTNCTSY